MKIRIDIDCSPSEARSFFGMPDVEGFNKAMMDRMQQQLAQHMEAIDPQEMMKAWMAGGMSSFERMRDAFMAGFKGAGSGGEKDKG